MKLLLHYVIYILHKLRKNRKKAYHINFILNGHSVSSFSIFSLSGKHSTFIKARKHVSQKHFIWVLCVLPITDMPNFKLHMVYFDNNQQIKLNYIECLSWTWCNLRTIVVTIIYSLFVSFLFWFFFIYLFVLLINKFGWLIFRFLLKNHLRV